ncbi:MAG: hypothetical protein H6834_12450 [Planctomycetes bacterium]|nr:hypothetical protein [Planctomycetota bacterium]
MKGDARLEKETVLTALQAKGYGVSSFDPPAAKPAAEYLVHVSGMT